MKSVAIVSVLLALAVVSLRAQTLSNGTIYSGTTPSPLLQFSTTDSIQELMLILEGDNQTLPEIVGATFAISAIKTTDALEY